MLTEKDKEWLADREENLEIFGGFFCPDCPEFVLEDEGIMYCGRGGYENCVVANPHKYIFKDAAEFEARVQKHIMELYTRAIYNTYNTATKGPHLRPRADIMRDARIAAEQEMEKTYE